jgi:hypothetical protein
MPDLPKKERKRRSNNSSSKPKEENGLESQRVASIPSSSKHQYPIKGPSSPENSPNSSSSRSVQPSPTSATPRQVMRSVDEDYDGAADALIVLSDSSNPDGPSVAYQSRHTMPSPQVPSHRDSISSTHTSPPAQAAPLKRPLSPGPDESSDNNKRSRVDLSKLLPRVVSAWITKPVPVPWPTRDPNPYGLLYPCHALAISAPGFYR